MVRNLWVAAYAAGCIILVANRIKDSKHALRGLSLISILYFVSVIYVTCIRGNRYGLGGFSFRFPLPFLKAIMNHHYGHTTNRSLLNVILFVPFGYLLPAVCSALREKDAANIKGYLKWWMTAGAGFLCSLLIESAQFVFKIGVFEIDDLVKNTMGAATGWVIWKLLDRNTDDWFIDRDLTNHGI